MVYLQPPSQSRIRRGRTLRYVLANLGVFALLFVLMEGLLSTLLLSSDLIREKLVPERLLHTQYDAELGWAPIPDLHIPDMYGPGVVLRTNSDGFRGPYNYTESIPPGKRRLICSGDSVTFGYGVDDDHSWCRLLETMDPRLQTINMALPGYGVDQAYLWYKRDAERLDHQVHVLAPITDDLRRMKATKFNGYGRPLLVVQDNQLAVTNVPVPADTYRFPWLTEVRRHLWSLRSAEAVRRARRFTQGWWTGDAEAVSPASLLNERVAADNQTVAVVSKLLQDLQALNRERASVLVVVYLPTLNERGPDTEFWTRVLATECAKLAIPFVNLVEVFDQMPTQETAALYLPDRGHFNEKGNRYVARLIHQRLARIPEVSRVLFGPGELPQDVRMRPTAKPVSRE